MREKTETLPGGTRVFTTERHKIGTDALLLSEFCQPKRDFAVADLGAGCGILILSMLDKGVRGACLALELDAEGAGLIEKAGRENQFTNLHVVQGDLRSYRVAIHYDMVVANPPYFDEGPLPPDGRRAAARHEVSARLEEVCKAAAAMLKDRGRFCLCYPPEKLAGLFEGLAGNGMQPKRMQFVRKSPDAAPWLVLLDARKNGGRGLAVLPDRMLPAGEPTIY
ncbi:methyltransferase [Ruminococcaceae bacterium OttesenSCG-928-I18]|nr:methyltransferase [Ruminococcaceae bacterium OttesenSCG-928-I18]